MGNTISYTTTPIDLCLGKARRYAGIPYAFPPTGEHRWRKPRPLPPSYKYTGSSPDSAFDATEFKPVCPQKVYHVGGSAEGGDGAYSEDCLFVNIWTPVPDPQISKNEQKWPVMLWLHGGWFQMGDPSQEAGMDPTELISTGKLNAIVVAIGYRLNVFGFLGGPDILTESEGGEHGQSGGNFGLWDQRLAAEWVYENIELFGGDRENITLAGRSAGAYSVEAQMLYEFRRDASRDSPRLYRRFFMDSNAIPAQPKSLSDTKEQFDELCAYFSIDLQASSAEKLARLRQKTAQELVAAIPNLKNHTFRPVTDDRFIHQGMAEYLASREFTSAFKASKARLLIGEVLNEETLYSTYNGPSEPTIEALRTQVRAPSRALVSNLVANGVDLADIWRYHIAYRLSFIDERVAPISFGVAHAMDKPFWKYVVSCILD
ncbi:Alpha/Beta hydrolase protein [Aspergillus similis]